MIVLAFLVAIIDILRDRRTWIVLGIVTLVIFALAVVGCVSVARWLFK